MGISFTDGKIAEIFYNYLSGKSDKGYLYLNDMLWKIFKPNLLFKKLTKQYLIGKKKESPPKCQISVYNFKSLLFSKLNVVWNKKLATLPEKPT